MGLAVEPVLAPGNELWRVTQEGHPVSPKLTSAEIHDFLDGAACANQPQQDG